MQKLNEDVMPQNLQRRVFFVRILGGIIGGLMAGSLVPKFLRRTPGKKNIDANVQVSINPLAVPRTDKEIQ
jgi:hypothetical protein